MQMGSGGSAVVDAQMASRWVTPGPLRDRPIHRWYLFPHSFTDDLVHALIDEWVLGPEDRVLDPFVGAGTTLLAAKERGVSAVGYDISPLAVLSSRVKTAAYAEQRLRQLWCAFLDSGGERCSASLDDAPELVRRALPEGRLEAFQSLLQRIEGLDCVRCERDFLRLGALAILPKFTATAANGGWLRWRDPGLPAAHVIKTFGEQVSAMLADVGAHEQSVRGTWRADSADARDLPESDATYTAVITSPPYPNRHDYTRVFGVELMLAFLSWEGTREVRHQSFQSHPEARPRRRAAPEYRSPKGLEEDVPYFGEPRIQRMLRGYFLDLYLSLCELKRVTRVGARIAMVVGNVRYGGKAIMVDELTAEVGEQAGLACSEIRAVRWRGNSAQQMGRFGRSASRESIVIFEHS